MSKSSTYDKNATETKAVQTATEAKAAREGKQYAYQPPQEAAAAPSKVEEQKQKVVSAFDDFMDALADHVAHTGPAPADASPSTTPGTVPGAMPPGAGTGVTAPGPGYSAPSAGAGYATPSTGAGTQPTTTPAAGGTEMSATESAAVEAVREANEVASQRSAYQLDRARESDKRVREQGSTSARVVKEAGGLFIRTESNKHTPDSNRSPLTESANWESSYGALGKGVAPTIEKMAVPNKRPETVPAGGTISSARPIDAWYGSFGNAIEKAMARAKVDHVVMEKIIGTDDRTRVTNNQAYPWRCVCSLLITANTGAQYIGTGWLVAPRLLLTAGHCVFMSDEGGWVTQIEVIPGRNAAERPYGSAVSREVRSVTGWTQDNDSNYDYGVIMLPADKRYGDQLGWFGYANRPDDYLRNLTLNLSGYPGDGGPAGIDGTQWYHSRSVMGVLDKQLTYDIDTYGGQSGAPVWEFASNGSRYGVAIHTFGDALNNGGTRITSDVFANIAGWVSEVP